MVHSLLGIGSNLGDRSAQMDAAVEALRQHADIRVVKVSDWVETDPVGGPDKQQSYMNGAILVETDLLPQKLLATLLDVERGLGRERDQRWGPRSVDLDVLLYDEEIVDEPGLAIPHPWMAIRRFVLQPAADVAGELIHPKTGWSLKALLENLNRVPFLIGVKGISTESQLMAIQRVAEDTGAHIAGPDTLLRSLAANRERTGSEPRGISFAPENWFVELGARMWQATARRARSLSVSNQLSRDPSSEGTTVSVARPVMVFEYWWWEIGRKASTLRSEFQPNLLIDLRSSDEPVENNAGEGQAEEQVAEKEAEDQADKAVAYSGPVLQLPAEDLERLAHDLKAAIESRE